MMDERERRRVEYEAMRASIRERGTARMVLAPVVFIGWAAVALGTASVFAVALGTLIPLLVLAAGFEAVFALHVNAERIGRYVQAAHEPDGGWEHVAMEFGRRASGGGPDPLFSRLFVLAVSANFFPVALGAETVEIVVLAILHLLFINRIRLAREFAAKQRAVDLEHFMSIAQEHGAGPVAPHGPRG